MISSVNSNVGQAAYAQASNSMTQTRQAPKAEASETRTSEKSEPASVQMREPEASQSGAALLKTLNSNEAQNMTPAASQPDANTQASRMSGLRAYNETGKSQFNFA
jgi:hypothetical protein